MGTRNLTVVIKDNEVKLSQYGQWDGYFEYTGIKFVTFCKKILQNKYHLDKFRDNINILKHADEIFKKEMKNTLRKFENLNGYSININEIFPQFSRDLGVEILDLVSNLKSYYYTDNKKFPIDICLDYGWVEYINVVNLDRNEIYLMKDNYTKITEEKSTCEIIKNTFPDFQCYLKYKIEKIPNINTVIKHYNDLMVHYGYNKVDKIKN